MSLVVSRELGTYDLQGLILFDHVVKVAPEEIIVVLGRGVHDAYDFSNPVENARLRE